MMRRKSVWWMLALALLLGGCVEDGQGDDDPGEGAGNNDAVNNSPNNDEPNNDAPNNDGPPDPAVVACQAVCAELGDCAELTQACTAQRTVLVVNTCQQACAADAGVRSQIEGLGQQACEQSVPEALEVLSLGIVCGDDAQRPAVDEAAELANRLCLQDCTMDVQCNGQAAFLPLNECVEEFCNNTDFFGFFDADDDLLACVEAQNAMGQCVNGLECGDYNLFYETDPDEDFPCKDTFEAFEAACAPYLGFFDEDDGQG